MTFFYSNANDSRIQSSSSHLLVKEEEPKTVSNSLQLCDCVTNTLDRGHLVKVNYRLLIAHHLIFEELVYEVGEMGVSLGVGALGEFEQALVDSLLQLKGSLHRLKAATPLHSDLMDFRGR